MGSATEVVLPLLLYVFPLVLAGISDVTSLRIPNWLTAGLAVAFFAAALGFGHEVDWLSHLASGLVVFAVGAVLFAFRVIGGGDVKLLAAVALWTGFAQLGPFLLLTALVGGVFALVVMLIRHPVLQISLLAVMRRLPSFAERNMPIPYGLPIAVAGILTAPSLPLLA